MLGPPPFHTHARTLYPIEYRTITTSWNRISRQCVLNYLTWGQKFLNIPKRHRNLPYLHWSNFYSYYNFQNKILVLPDAVLFFPRGKHWDIYILYIYDMSKLYCSLFGPSKYLCWLDQTVGNAYKYWRYLEGSSTNSKFLHGGKERNCASIKRKPTVWRLDEESDRNFASPILFNLYTEYLMNESLAEVRNFNIGEGLLSKCDFRMIRLL